MNKPVFNWAEYAACKGMPAEIFFPDSGEMDKIRLALEICESCPVKQQCLNTNLHEEMGVWGGTTARRRRQMRRQRQGV